MDEILPSESKSFYVMLLKDSSLETSKVTMATTVVKDVKLKDNPLIGELFFDDLNAPLWTDEKFCEMEYPEHQKKESHLFVSGTLHLII